MEPCICQSLAACGAFLLNAATKDLVAAAPNSVGNSLPIDVTDWAAKVWELIRRAERDDDVARLLQGENSSLSLVSPKTDDPEQAIYCVEMRYMPHAETPLVLVLVVPTAVRKSELRRDSLTGLFDRGAALRIIENWLTPSAEGFTPFGVLFVDLDGFKQVNDEHGHAIGDQVLRVLAHRWSRCVRDGDVVARYGGDEFLVLIRGVSKPQDADPIIQRISEATLAPVTTDGGDFSVSVTIGVAISQPGRTQSEIKALISAADEDMYVQKRLRQSRGEQRTKD